MKRLLSVFLLLSVTVSLLAQDSLKVKQRANSIFIAPFNMFDFVNPSIQIGYERMIKNKYAIQVEVGYILNHSIENALIDLANGVKNCPYTNKGFKVRTEFKYFFIVKRKIGFYISSELFYTQNKSGVSDNFYRDPTFSYPTPPPPDANAYTDFFYNDKKRMGLNVKTGLKFWFGYFFDGSSCRIGFGVQNEQTFTTRQS